MKLRSARIKNFRSIYTSDKSPVEIEFGGGANYFAGPNNAGKSNILRAVELALRPNAQLYDPDRDMPKSMHYAYPTITLEFEVTNTSRSIYNTLLKYLRDYEHSVSTSGNTYADQNRVKYHVQFRTNRDSRQEQFLVCGHGARRGDSKLLKKALTQFHKVVRFVRIRSGEALESLLKRGFLEILGPVLEERREVDVDAAEEGRQKYLDSVRKHVLDHLGEHITGKISDFIPNITDVQLSPSVTALEDAIADVSFNVQDAFRTGLRDKGTGVRGALIMTLMSFIAESSRRFVVFAIEEPEAFLHPETHAALANSIHSFTEDKTTSVLVTTHSPFLLNGTNNSDGRVFSVSKADGEQTSVALAGSMKEAVFEARQLLLGNEAVPNTLEMVDRIPASTRLVLIVEGYTDKVYIETAVQRLEREDLLEEVHIIPAKGADDAAMRSIVLRKIWGSQNQNVTVLLDDDVHGQSAKHLLTHKLNFQNRDEVWMYSEHITKHGENVEAEDLFSESLLEEFFKVEGESVLDEKSRRNGDNGWHYGFTGSGKSKFMDWIEDAGSENDFKDWIEFLERVRDNSMPSDQ